MTMQIDIALWDRFVDELAARPVCPLFVTVSGAHLYGFPSPDSDVDLRGCHQLPLREVVGLIPPEQTFQWTGVHRQVEVDLVSHEIGKYFALLVKNNGYILEQIFSPLVVRGQAFLDELRPIARRCITKFHYHHYRGFYASQRKLLDKQPRKGAKQVLYAYRVLLTGIHLLETGDVEANLRVLNQQYRVPGIDELIASKTEEKIAPEMDWEQHADQLQQLESQLDESFAHSPLPEDRDTTAVHQLLVDLRLESRQC